MTFLHETFAVHLMHLRIVQTQVLVHILQSNQVLRQERSHWGQVGVQKVQKFKFQILTDLQKLYISEISQFLPCKLQFWDNLRLSIFSDYIVEEDHFPLGLLRRSVLKAGTSEKCLFVDHPKDGRNKQDFKRQVTGPILDLPRKSLKQEKHRL